MCSRKDHVAYVKEMDWRGFEGSREATEKSSEIEWPEWMNI